MSPPMLCRRRACAERSLRAQNVGPARTRGEMPGCACAQRGKCRVAHAHKGGNAGSAFWRFSLYGGPLERSPPYARGPAVLVSAFVQEYTNGQIVVKSIA
ncbi:hypothetical protein FKM82_020483 [Ascaphus truei]